MKNKTTLSFKANAFARSCVAKIMIAALLLAAVPRQLPAAEPNLPGIVPTRTIVIMAATLGGAVAVAVLLLRGKKGPKVELDTKHLDFPDVRPGSSEQGSVSVRNLMQAPITITEISIEGAANGFSLPQGAQVPHTLAPGEKVGVLVGFTPSSSSLRSSRLKIVAVSSEDSKRSTTKVVKLTASN